MLADEKSVGPTQRTQPVALFYVVCEGHTRRVLDRDEARLPELGLTDRQDTVLEIHVWLIEAECLSRS
jgi:hypothetical protein